MAKGIAEDPPATNQARRAWRELIPCQSMERTIAADSTTERSLGGVQAMTQGRSLAQRVSMPCRSFSPGDIPQRHYAGVFDISLGEFQCLAGHSVRGHALGWSNPYAEIKKFQCLAGHSVPGLVVSLSQEPPINEELQCLDGHSVPGLPDINPVHAAWHVLV
jgi:hypothetical protein